MSVLRDVLLSKPMPQLLFQVLLYWIFFLHLTFVLLLIGTTLLGMYYFIETWFTGRFSDPRWDKRILGTHLPFKSLAVVLGIGPLLLIQVGYTIPFLSAVNFYATYWLLLIVFMVVAFVLADTIGHKDYVHRYVHLFLGMTALALTLVIPGVFVAILVTAESPARWNEMILHGNHLFGDLAWFWFLRYLHVLGAAVVVAAMFHYLFTSDHPDKRQKLASWLVAGMLWQVVIGVMLYEAMPGAPSLTIQIIVYVTIAVAMVFLAVVVYCLQRSRPIAAWGGTSLLLLILLGMLLARQVHQASRFLPLNRQVVANVAPYQARLRPYHDAALVRYGHELEYPITTGAAKYARSCAFCHGKDADGHGVDAPQPEHTAGPPDHHPRRTGVRLPRPDQRHPRHGHVDLHVLHQDPTPPDHALPRRHLRYLQVAWASARHRRGERYAPRPDPLDHRLCQLPRQGRHGQQVRPVAPAVTAGSDAIQHDPAGTFQSDLTGLSRHKDARVQAPAGRRAMGPRADRDQPAQPEGPRSQQELA